MALASGTRLGPYEVLRLIGSGGMGEVYRARDTRLDRTVALKVLPPELSTDPERRERFEREARTISTLNHPHICTLHDVGEQAGQAYLVMEHLAGDTLAERLKKGPLPLDQALDLGAQIAEALDAAHKHGIVHRDLKPGNVMLTKSGAKLLDFGLAKFKGHGEQPAAAHLASAPTQTTPLTVASSSTEKVPDTTRGRISRCSDSVLAADCASNSPRACSAATSAALGSAQRSATNIAAVSGISSITSTRTTISSA